MASGKFPLVIPDFYPVIPDYPPLVIPAKAGIHKPPNNPTARNQAPSAVIGSLLHFLHPVIPAKAGIQTITAKFATRNQA